MDRKLSVVTQDLDTIKRASLLDTLSSYRNFLGVFNSQALQKKIDEIDSFPSLNPGSSVLELEEMLVKNNTNLKSLTSYSKEVSDSLNAFLAQFLNKHSEQISLSSLLSSNEVSYKTDTLSYSDRYFSTNEIEDSDVHISLNNQITLGISNQKELTIRNVEFRISELESSNSWFQLGTFGFYVSTQAQAKIPQTQIKIVLETESLINHLYFPIIFNLSKNLLSLNLNNSQGQSVCSYDKRSLSQLINSNPCGLEIFLSEPQAVESIDLVFESFDIKNVPLEEFYLSDSDLASYKKIFLSIEKYINAGELDLHLFNEVSLESNEEKTRRFLIPLGLICGISLNTYKSSSYIKSVKQYIKDQIISFKTTPLGSLSSTLFFSSFLEFFKEENSKLEKAIKIFNPTNKQTVFPLSVLDQEDNLTYYLPTPVSSFSIVRSQEASSPVAHSKIKDSSGYFDLGFILKELINEENVLASFEILTNDFFNYRYVMPSVFGWYDNDLFFHFFKNTFDYNAYSFLFVLSRDSSSVYKTPVIDNINIILIKKK